MTKALTLHVGLVGGQNESESKTSVCTRLSHVGNSVTFDGTLHFNMNVYLNSHIGINAIRLSMFSTAD